MVRITASRVQETSTNTGTAAFLLIGAVPGYRTFASVCTIGDRLPYVIEAVDANGSPTGEWEAGVGTYSALNTLERTTVQESSNGNALVSFSVGLKRVSLQLHGTGDNRLDIGGEATFAPGYGVTFRNASDVNVAGVYNDGAGAVENNVTTAFRVATWGGEALLLEVTDAAAALTVPVAAPNVSGNNTGDQDLSPYATSSALGAGLAARELTVTPGTADDYYRGDKTWQPMPQAPIIAAVAATANFGAAAPVEPTADTTLITADSTVTQVGGPVGGVRPLFEAINDALETEAARRGM